MLFQGAFSLIEFAFSLRGEFIFRHYCRLCKIHCSWMFSVRYFAKWDILFNRLINRRILCRDGCALRICFSNLPCFWNNAFLQSVFKKANLWYFFLGNFLLSIQRKKRIGFEIGILMDWHVLWSLESKIHIFSG